MKRKTDAAVREMLVTGYRHHSYEKEKQLLDRYLEGKTEEVLDEVLAFAGNNAHMLGPNPRRALRNSMICLVSVVCRAAILHGAENEYCFALSDFYINRIEAVTDSRELTPLAQEVLRDFRELALKARETARSPVVRRALLYIDSHLFGPCRVKDIAAYVKRNPNYLAGLFQKEMHQAIHVYVTDKKMELARKMLLENDTVTDIAEILGYSGASHFSRVFYGYHGMRPSRFAQDGVTRL